MTVNSTEGVRLFTVDEANAALPLIRAITRDIVELTADMIDRRERLHYLKKARRQDERDLYSEELDDAERNLEHDAKRLQELVDELTDLGVELKSLPEGLIDFPSIRDGELVYLCWRYDEPEIAYWHELNAGFAGRQALNADSGSQQSTPAEGKVELN